jgi:hypothetical protein
LLVGGAVAVAIGINAWFYAHYAAPVTGLLFALVAQSLRRLRVWRRRSGTGLFLARAIPAVCVLTIAVRLAVQPFWFLLPPDWPMTWFHTPKGNVARAQTAKKLAAMDGKHLAIVRYGPGHQAVMNEWVYNEADIDRARVVWARELDPAANQELLRYFPDRKVWLVEPGETRIGADEVAARITPY